MLVLLCAMPLSLIGSALAEDAPPPGEGQDVGIVREIEVRGNIRISQGDILRMIRTRVGRPFDAKVWDEDWHKLIDAGLFANVRVTPPLDLGNNQLKLVIDLVELAQIKKITFKGAKALNETTLRAAIKSREGGRFQQGQVHQDARTIENKYKEEAFRDVAVTYSVDPVASHTQLVAGKEQQVPDEVVINFNIEEGFPIAIRGITFVGNKIFTEDQLIAVMQSKPRKLFRPGDLKESMLEVDKKLLERHYLKYGFIDMSIDKIDIETTEETYWNWFRKRKKMADVTITITEGPQYHVGNVEVTGNKNVEKRDIESVMKVRSGYAFSELILHEDVDKIKELYGSYGRGFTNVRTESKLVTDPERLKKAQNLYDVKVNIQEGRELTVRNIYARGNLKTKEKVIVRNVPLYPGDRVDTTRMKFAKDAINRMGYFDESSVRVELEPVEDNPEEADVVIDVVEKSTGEFNFGAGISSSTGIMGQVSLLQRNFDYKDWPKSVRDFITGNSFTGAGQNFGISASVGTKQQNYNINFTEPWAFDRPIRVGGSVFRTVDSTYQNFDQTSTGFSLTLGKRLWGPRWDGDITYTFNYSEINNTGLTDVLNVFSQQDGHRILSSLRPRIVYDSRNSNLLPSRGWFMQAAVEVGDPVISDIQWIKPTLDIAKYFTMYQVRGGGKHILELHGFAGMIEQYGATKEIQPFQRFYAGGIGSIRGFQTNSIAPKLEGYTIGGKKSWNVSAEYSIPLYEEIVRGLAFVDAGSVMDGGQNDPALRLTDRNGLRASIGLGLAIRTPFSPAPLRIYISKPISKNDGDQTKTIDFTFGTRF